jgi:putative alpha-1,2-mannosidase
MFLRHDEIMQGGELRFVMSDKEHATWSTQPLAVPFSMSAPK